MSHKYDDDLSTFEPLQLSAPCLYPIGPLSSIAYSPDFVSDLEEASLLNDIRSCKQQWVNLNGRRCMAIGGMVQPKGLIPTPIPSWGQRLMSKVMNNDLASWFDQGAAPNHLLVNRYEPGEGIMAHSDGPAYHPAVLILSLGSPAVLRFREKRETEGEEVISSSPRISSSPISILLMPRSLVAFRGHFYDRFLHFIEPVETERLDSSIINLHLCPQEIQGTSEVKRGHERVSLTIRNVPKIIKGLSFIGR